MWSPLLPSVSSVTVCPRVNGVSVLSVLGHLLDYTGEQCHLDVGCHGTTAKPDSLTAFGVAVPSLGGSAIGIFLICSWSTFSFICLIVTNLHPFVRLF